jgi:DNA-binding PadR family transcriptional regulator
MDVTIDRPDFRILHCLHTADDPLWKNLIHEEYNDEFTESLSEQTIGRRVDDLHDAGLLQSSIRSPDDINRDLIIGYQLTDSGRTVLIQKRRDILLTAAKPTLFRADQTEDADRPIPKEELVELICAEFQLDRATGELLRTEYTWEELTILVIVYLVKHRAIDVLTDTDLDQITDIIVQSPEIADVFTYQITSENQ